MLKNIKPIRPEEVNVRNERSPITATGQSAPFSQMNIFPTENRFTPLKYTILPTAIVLVHNAHNVPVPLRVVLDIGSNANVITEEAALKLGFSTRDSNMQISMIGGGVIRNVKEFLTTVRSRNPLYANFVRDITCLIVPRLHSPLPHRNINWKNFESLQTCFLADPRFHRAGKVDMIIGSDITLRSFLGDSRNLSNGAFVKDTKFGWIVAGSFTDKYPPQ